MAARASSLIAAAALAFGGAPDAAAQEPQHDFLYGDVRFDGRDLTVRLEEIAHVAIFDVRSDGRVRLLYPQANRGGQLASARHDVRYPRLASLGGLADRILTENERRALPPDLYGYLLVLAADRPLELFGFDDGYGGGFSLAPPLGPGDHVTAERRDELLLGVLSLVAPAEELRWGVAWIPYALGRGVEVARVALGPYLPAAGTLAAAEDGSYRAERDAGRLAATEEPSPDLDDLRYGTGGGAVLVGFGHPFGHFSDPFGPFAHGSAFFCPPGFGLGHGFGHGHRFRHHRFRHGFGHRFRQGHQFGHRFGHGAFFCAPGFAFGFGRFPTRFRFGPGCPVGLVFGGIGCFGGPSSICFAGADAFVFHDGFGFVCLRHGSHIVRRSRFGHPTRVFPGRTTSTPRARALPSGTWSARPKPEAPRTRPLTRLPKDDPDRVATRGAPGGRIAVPDRGRPVIPSGKARPEAASRPFRLRPERIRPDREPKPEPPRRVPAAERGRVGDGPTAQPIPRPRPPVRSRGSLPATGAKARPTVSASPSERVAPPRSDVAARGRSAVPAPPKRSRTGTVRGPVRSPRPVTARGSRGATKHERSGVKPTSPAARLRAPVSPRRAPRAAPRSRSGTVGVLARPSRGGRAR